MIYDLVAGTVERPKIEKKYYEADCRKCVTIQKSREQRLPGNHRNRECVQREAMRQSSKRNDKRLKRHKGSWRDFGLRWSSV